MYCEEEQIRSDARLHKEGRFLPAPTYTFQAGDRVVLGPEWSLRNRALQPENVTISRVISDRLYEIDYTFVRINYGQPNRVAHQKELVRWLDIRPAESPGAMKLLRNADLNLYWKDALIGELLEWAYRDGVDSFPYEAREHRWSEKSRESLVESVFCHTPMSGFVFIRNGEGAEYQYTVLDGVQRLNALKSFFENRFSCRGVFYNDLTYRERDWFYRYPVSISTIGAAGRDTALRYYHMLNRFRLED